MKNGILLPIFSLPNKYGIGTLGKSAYDFIDFLKKSHQDYWQLLPDGVTSFGDSPYQSFSVFAKNPYFIDLDILVKDKLLTKKDLLEANLINETNYIDYGNLFNNKIKLLKKAYLKHDLFKDEFEAFKKDNSYWLKDFSLFMALKEKHNYACFNTFEDEYKYHDELALANFYKDNKDLVEAYSFIQFLYVRQYEKLLKYAHENGIQIIGDMPIYVAYDSCDVWAHPTEFMLDQWLNTTKVAGVPPDYFSEDGQLWGNPLYNYEVAKNNDYDYWVKRISYATKFYDYIRIDHFRGFSAFYAVPSEANNAKNGIWIPGPKMDLFNIINKKVPNAKIIAENLGLLDNDVYKLIKDCNYPGMRILEFEFYSKDNIKELKNINPNNIIYPGTHDNNTFVSWFNDEASPEEKEIVKDELKYTKDAKLNELLINYAYSFKVDTVILTYQDILGLDKKARINTPGKASGNWQFKFKENDFNSHVAKMLKKYSLLYKKM